MTDFSGALDDLEKSVAAPPPASGLEDAPQGAFTNVLADIDKAKSPPAENPGWTLAPGKTPDTHPIAQMGNSLIDALVAGMQGTSPHVAGNYQLAPKPEQDFFAEMGRPRDTEKFVALRDPGTSQYAVYMRNPDMAESGATAIGRVLSQTAIPETGIPAVGAASIPTASQNLMQDFERLGVRPSVPAVGQGIGSRLAANVVSKIPFFGGPVASASEQAVGDTARAARNLAAWFGGAENAEEAGKAAQAGIGSFVNGAAPEGMSAAQIIASPTRSSSFAVKSAALYDRADKFIDPSAQIPLDNTLAALRGPGDRFPSNPSLGEKITNPQLGGLYQTAAPKTVEIPPSVSSLVDASGNPIVTQAAQKLTQGGTLTFPELKEFRSYIGRLLGDPRLVSDIPRADLKNVYRGMSTDMETAATAAGPEAAQAMRNATQYYNAGIDRIDRLETLLKNSPEQTMAAINDAAGTGRSANAGMLRSLQRSISPDQWGDVAGAVIRKMGEPTAGAKSVLPGQDQFSATSFVTNWNKLSDAAKDTLFGATNVPGSTRESLDTLSRVADAQKQIAKFANPSGTASHNIAGLGAGALAEHFFDLTSHPIETALGVLGGYGASRALMSPGFARWLYAMPATVAQAPSTAVGMQRAVSSLDQLSRLDPSLAPYARAISANAAQPGQQQ